MTLPILYPEEFVAGYVGNIRQFLSLRSNAATIDELRRRSGPEGSMKMSVINLLAAASGKSVEDVVAQHTLTPLSRAFAIDDVDCTHGADRNQTRLRVHSARFSSAYPQYCPMCATEDLDYWGISYWRRYHLINGIGYCLKHHETALISVSTPRPFAFSPDHHYSKFQSVGQNNGSPEKFFVDPFVQRYAEICAGLLETKLPIGRLSMAVALRSRLSCLGLQVSTAQNSTVLHDHVRAQAPREWLVKHFPKFASPQRNHNLNSSCLNSKVLIASELIVLLCAALYDSATEALTDMLEKRDEERSGPAKTEKQSRPPGFWTSRAVIKVYEDSGCNTNAVASHFQLTERATREMMTLHGYPGLYRALSTKAGQALKMFLMNSSYEDAAKHAADEREEFEHLLRTAATPLREVFRRQAVKPNESVEPNQTPTNS